MPTFGNESVSGYRNDTHSGGTVVAGVAQMPVNGWITEVNVHANGSGATVNRRLGLWNKDRARIYNGAVVSMGSAANWRTDAGLSVRVAAGEDVWIGIYGAGDFQVRIRDDFPGEKREHGAQSGIPATLAGTVEPDRVACYCAYVANVAPSVGTWRPEAPSGIISSANPTLAGNTPHPSGDSAHDHTSEVHLQLWRASDGVMVYDSLFATTTTERNQGYFSRTPSSLGFALAPATTYRAKFRHRDSWGVYPASFSSEIEFTTSDIPAPPAPTSPSGKINAISGHSYAFVYTHPNGLAANAKQIQVWNAAGSSLLFDSGTLAVSPTAANGETISTPEFHADLAWGTAYKWRARVRDTSNNWSNNSAFKDFKTNAAPHSPVLLSPVDGKTTLSRAFSAEATDPDGDAITAAEIEVVNADTGAVVSGYPAAMTVSGTGGAEPRLHGPRERHRLSCGQHQLQVASPGNRRLRERLRRLVGLRVLPPRRRAHGNAPRPGPATDQPDPPALRGVRPGNALRLLDRDGQDRKRLHKPRGRRGCRLRHRRLGGRGFGGRR